MNNKLTAKDSFDFKTFFIISGSVISGLLGAGTATGQEILQYFVPFGLMGIPAVIIAMLLHGVFFYLVTGVAFKIAASSSNDVYKYYAGEKAALVLEWINMVVVFIIVTVMIAGAGATVNQYSGIDPNLGRLITAALVLATVLLRLRKAVNILGALGPVIIVMIFAIGIISLILNFDKLPAAVDIVKGLEMRKPLFVNSWIPSGFVYFGYVFPAFMPFLAGLGGMATNKTIKATQWGAVTGAAVMVLGVVFLYLAELCSVAEVASAEVPTLVLALNISSAFGVMFAILIFLALYTTAVPMLWSLCNKAEDMYNKRDGKGSPKNRKDLVYNVTAVVASIIGYFGSSLGFGELISIIYPFIGIVGIILMVLVTARTLLLKNTKTTAGPR